MEIKCKIRTFKGTYIYSSELPPGMLGGCSEHFREANIVNTPLHSH